uniref:EF-hand domain-containing protein n=1 Tax=Vitrella brassicaformis TaxID=1169539 RepID=A0A7S1P2V4_9ALVE|mmetsp:Transcript_23557/g.58205  ORF Transcript_23557/g.58205 Transcript_23557/m.58205 type:complete len:672 (+) Transcript_23557:247-2262(+)
MALSRESEFSLLRFLKAVGEAEQEVEGFRCRLAECSTFEPYAAFCLLDRFQNGSLTSSDFLYFLDHVERVNAESEIFHLVRHFDRDGDGRVSYAEFLDAILPSDVVLRSLATGRSRYALPMRLAPDAERTLGALLHRELCVYRDLEVRRRVLFSRYDFNLLDAFRFLDRFQQGYLTPEGLDRVYREYALDSLPLDIKSLFRRLDRDQDDRLSYVEFVDAVLPTTRTTECPLSCFKAPPLTYSRVDRERRHEEKLLLQSKLGISPRRGVSPLRSAYADYADRDRSPLLSSAMARRVKTPEPRVPLERSMPARPTPLPPPPPPEGSAVSMAVSAPYPYRMQEDIERPEPLPPARRGRELEKEEEEAEEGARVRSPSPEQDRAPPPAPVLSKSAPSYAGTRAAGGSPPLRATPPLSYTQPAQTYSALRYSSPVPTCPLVPPCRMADVRQVTAVLRDQIIADRELERTRQDLALRSDFNLLDFYKLLDKCGRGSVSRYEVTEGMRVVGVYPTNCEVDMLLKRYVKGGDGRLRYSDLADAFLPHDPHYAEMLANRMPAHRSPLEVSGPQWFALDTRALIGQTFRQLMQAEMTAESHRSSLRGIDLFEAFKAIDADQDGYLTIDELRNALRNYGVAVTERDLLALINRLDKSKNGRVSYGDFVSEFGASSSRYALDC